MSLTCRQRSGGWTKLFFLVGCKVALAENWCEKAGPPCHDENADTLLLEDALEDVQSFRSLKETKRYCGLLSADYAAELIKPNGKVYSGEWKTAAKHRGFYWDPRPWVGWTKYIGWGSSKGSEANCRKVCRKSVGCKYYRSYRDPGHKHYWDQCVLYPQGFCSVTQALHAQPADHDTEDVQALTSLEETKQHCGLLSDGYAAELIKPNGKVYRGEWQKAAKHRGFYWDPRPWVGWTKYVGWGSSKGSRALCHEVCRKSVGCKYYRSYRDPGHKRYWDQCVLYPHGFCLATHALRAQLIDNTRENDQPFVSSTDSEQHRKAFEARCAADLNDTNMRLQVMSASISEMEQYASWQAAEIEYLRRKVQLQNDRGLDAFGLRHVCLVLISVAILSLLRKVLGMLLSAAYMHAVNELEYSFLEDEVEQNAAYQNDSVVDGVEVKSSIDLTTQTSHDERESSECESVKGFSAALMHAMNELECSFLVNEVEDQATSQSNFVVNDEDIKSSIDLSTQTSLDERELSDSEFVNRQSSQTLVGDCLVEDEETSDITPIVEPVQGGSGYDDTDSIAESDFEIINLTD